MTDRDSGSLRRDRAKLVLAGIAVAGIGAAVTTAAWTDDVWFSAEAEAATFDLQGRVEPDGAWLDEGIDPTDETVDGEDVVIEIPADTFAGLVPGSSVDVELGLLNAGTSDIDVATPVAQDLLGAIFTGTAPASVTIGALGTTTLAPDETTTFTVTVSTSDTWPETYINTSGTFSVLVVGTAS